MRTVVGGVVYDGSGRVLAARRVRPDGWEFPGGKVEPGETDEQALARELREELDIGVEVGDRVGPEVLIGGDMLLRTFTARLVDGEPDPREHAELRWLGPDELDAVAWLPADLTVVAALKKRARRR